MHNFSNYYPQCDNTSCPSPCCRQHLSASSFLNCCMHHPHGGVLCQKATGVGLRASLPEPKKLASMSPTNLQHASLILRLSYSCCTTQYSYCHTLYAWSELKCVCSVNSRVTCDQLAEHWIWPSVLRLAHCHMQCWNWQICNCGARNGILFP